MANTNDNSNEQLNLMKQLKEAIRESRNELQGFNMDLLATYAAYILIYNILQSQSTLTADLIKNQKEVLLLKLTELDKQLKIYEAKSKEYKESQEGKKEKSALTELQLWLKKLDIITLTAYGAINDLGKVDPTKLLASFTNVIKDSFRTLYRPESKESVKASKEQAEEKDKKLPTIIAGGDSKTEKTSANLLSSFTDKFSKIGNSLSAIEKKILNTAFGKRATSDRSADDDSIADTIAPGYRLATVPGRTEANGGTTSLSTILNMLPSAGGGGGGVPIDPTAGGGLAEVGGEMASGMGAEAMAGGPLLAVMIMLIKGIGKLLNGIAKDVGQLVDVATLLLEDDSTKKFDARLYGLLTSITGLNANFIDMALEAMELVLIPANMPFINAKELLSNMTELVNQGIAYNVELRALWDTMMDRIVSTFDVLNPTLLRLILLQRTELTDTYAGVEAAITRTLNSMFTDTLYLESTYDAVWGAMTDALANVDTDLGTAIAYQVQLWLGSLSSLGLSSNAAEGIATQINALLTGNSENMGDTGTRLLAMAAADAGLSFADLLVNGILSSQDMSKFMNSIITVLLNIYTLSEGNNVLLSEWGSLLNLSISDWKAISNLSATAVLTLAALNTYGLANAKAEFEYIEDNLVTERTLISERISTAVENMKFAGAWNIASEADDYLQWRVLGAVEELLNTVTGDIPILGELVSGVASLAKVPLILDNYFYPLVSLLASLPTLLGLNGKYTLFTDILPTANDVALLVFSEILNEGTYVTNYDEIKKLSFSAMIPTVGEFLFGETGGIFDSITNRMGTLILNATGFYEFDDEDPLLSGASNSNETVSVTGTNTDLTENSITNTTGASTSADLTTTPVISGSGDNTGNLTTAKVSNLPTVRDRYLSSTGATANETSGTTSNASDDTVNGTTDRYGLDDIFNEVNRVYRALTVNTGVPVKIVSVDDSLTFRTYELGVTEQYNYRNTGSNKSLAKTIEDNLNDITSGWHT